MSELPSLSDDDMREIFALFSSCAEEEVTQIYSPSHRLYFRNERLDEEYTLVEGRSK